MNQFLLIFFFFFFSSSLRRKRLGKKRVQLTPMRSFFPRNFCPSFFAATCSKIKMAQPSLDIEELHNFACENEEETYVDPETGLMVFTAYSHWKRGSFWGFYFLNFVFFCCQDCPFQESAVGAHVDIVHMIM